MSSQEPYTIILYLSLIFHLSLSIGVQLLKTFKCHSLKILLSLYVTHSPLVSSPFFSLQFSFLKKKKKKYWYSKLLLGHFTKTNSHKLLNPMNVFHSNIQHNTLSWNIFLVGFSRCYTLPAFLLSLPFPSLSPLQAPISSPKPLNIDIQG